MFSLLVCFYGENLGRRNSENISPHGPKILHVRKSVFFFLLEIRCQVYHTGKVKRRVNQCDRQHYYSMLMAVYSYGEDKKTLVR